MKQRVLIKGFWLKEKFNMYKVLFITCCPSPSRVEFFNTLGKNPDMDITVLFMESEEEQRHRSSKWFADNNYKYFRGYIVKERVGFKKKQYFGYICKDIIRFLKEKYDEIIFCGYAYPTFMYGMQYLIRHKIPYSIEVDGGFVAREKIIKYKLKSFFISHANKWYSSGKNTNKYLIHYGAQKKNIIVYPFTSMNEQDFSRAWNFNDKNPHNVIKRIVMNYPVFLNKRQELKRVGKEKLGVSQDSVVLTIGQFVHRKGFDLLLKAATGINKGIKIFIIGGAVTDEYNSLAQKYDLENVEFVNFQSKDDLKYYFWSADLFVLPTREDIWGLVINEAMAYGLPIITTNKCNSGLELVTKENGYIIPVNDVDALKKSINDCFNNRNMMEMGWNSLLKIQGYTIENMAAKHIRVWNGKK